LILLLPRFTFVVKQFHNSPRNKIAAENYDEAVNKVNRETGEDVHHQGRDWAL